jgi:broad specificity phosphatase PhoE
MIVVLVRHAKAVPRRQWPEDDLSRPLDDRGFAQAPEIARRVLDILSGERDVELFSSPSLRCVQTLEPLAAKLGADIRPEPLLGDLESGESPEELIMDANAAVDWLGSRGMRFLDDVTRTGRRVGSQKPHKAVIACSHGDVIPVTLDVLCERDGVRPATVGNAKGSFWVLRFNGGRCTSAEYVPAP